MKEKFKTHKNNLLLLAGIVWAIAGFNILRIGIITYQNYFNWWRLLISVAIYLAFQLFVFGKMVKKHTKRITQYEVDRQYFYKFFDLKGFIVMIFMMTFGIVLRKSNICPDVFIAVFYSGLGASLLTAGILFVINYIKECIEANKTKNENKENKLENKKD